MLVVCRAGEGRGFGSHYPRLSPEEPDLRHCWVLPGEYLPEPVPYRKQPGASSVATMPLRGF